MTKARPIASSGEPVGPVDPLLLRVMDASAVGMALAGSDGVFIAVNHALIDLLQRDRATLLESRWQDLVEPEDVDEVAALVQQVFDGTRDSMRLRRRYTRPSGTVLWVDAAISAIRDEQGALLHFLLQVFDVTDEVRTRERYRLLAEHGADVVVSGSNDGVLQWLSPSVEGLLGWRPGEMAGTALLDYVHPDDQPRVRAAQADLLEGLQVALEIRLKTRDGGYRWLGVLAKPELDTDGHVVGRIGGWRDIESEVRIRQALAESEQRFRLLAENASDVVLHLQGDVVLWASPSITDALGWSPADWQGHSLREFIHADDDALIDGMHEAAMRGRRLTAPARMRDSSGAFAWVEAQFAGFRDPLGVMDGIVVSFRTMSMQMPDPQGGGGAA